MRVVAAFMAAYRICTLQEMDEFSSCSALEVYINDQINCESEESEAFLCNCPSCESLLISGKNLIQVAPDCVQKEEDAETWKMMITSAVEKMEDLWDSYCSLEAEDQSVSFSSLAFVLKRSNSRI